jgi:hypothetical protein
MNQYAQPHILDLLFSETSVRKSHYRLHVGHNSRTDIFDSSAQNRHSYLLSLIMQLYHSYPTVLTEFIPVIVHILYVLIDVAQ